MRSPPVATTASGSTPFRATSSSQPLRRSNDVPALAPCRSTASRSASRTASTSPGVPDHARLPGLRLRPDPDRSSRAAPARRRRDLRRQDEPRPVRHRSERHPHAVPRPAQRVRRGPDLRWVQLRAPRWRWRWARCPFAVATDTAGSGRVPAALNGIVGFKPSRGLISTVGLVPACRSLDCISLMAGRWATCDRVFDVVAGPDDADPWSRDRGPRHPTGVDRCGSACRPWTSWSSSATTRCAAHTWPLRDPVDAARRDRRGLAWNRSWQPAPCSTRDPGSPSGSWSSATS